MKGRSTTVVGARLPDDLVKKLDEHCRFKTGWTRSEAIKKAVEMLLGIKWDKK